MGGMRFLLMLALLSATGCATTGGGAAAAGAAAPTSAAGAAGTTIVAIAPPAGPPHPNIWQFLGFDYVFAGMSMKHQHVMLFLQGYFPGLAGPPTVLPIDDPANLASPNPSVSAAAAVAAEEAGAAQKIEAIKFLAKKGCGCYPDIHDALLAGLDDCVEVVRFETARALYEAAHRPCEHCNESSCCSAQSREALYRTAYDISEAGCYVEPSTRVRRAARLALNSCGGHCPAPQEDAPEEAPHIVPPSVSGPTFSGIEQRAPAESPDPHNDSPDLTRRGILIASRLREAQQNLPEDEPQPDIPMEGEDSEHIVATVNGERITDEEVRRGIQLRLGPLAEDLSADDALVAFRDELLWAIDVRLLTGIDRGDDEPVHTAAFAGSSMPELHADREARARAVLAERVDTDIQVAYEQILERYRRDVDRYRLEPAVRWEQMTVPANSESAREAARDLITDIRVRLLGGRLAVADQSDLAHVSTATVDWTELSRIEPRQLRDTLTRLGVGELSSIFEDPEGFHMIRLLERRTDRVLPLAEVVETIRSELIREAQRQTQDAYLRTLRSQASIWTDVPLDGVEPQSSPIPPATEESNSPRSLSSGFEFGVF